MVHIDHEKKYSSFNNFKIHFNVVLFLDELYLDGENCPLQPQAHSWYISNAKLSGRRGGELSPRKLLHNLSASLRVIIPHLLKQRKIKRRSKELSLFFFRVFEKKHPIRIFKILCARWHWQAVRHRQYLFLEIRCSWFSQILWEMWNAK